VVSDQWDSANVGGEEVDVDWLLPAPEEAAVPQPRRSEEPAVSRPAGWQPIVV
jgi:hypothetical protein